MKRIELATKIAMALATVWALVPKEHRSEVLVDFWAAVTHQTKRAIRTANALLDRLMDEIERLLNLSPGTK